MEEKDELLEAFENPDMVDTSDDMDAEETKTEDVMPEIITPEPVSNQEESTIEPVEPTSEVETTTNEAIKESTLENVENEEPVPEAPVVEENKGENVTEKNNSNSEEDPGFVKKNLIFLLIICAVIAVFIIFLPKILSLLSGGRY